MSVHTIVKRGRGRPSGADSSLPSETQLLETALAVFAREGFEGTSMRGMARQLGVSHNFLSSRYGSKEDFWKKIVAYAGRSVEREVREQQNAIEASGLGVEDRLRALFRMHLVGLPMLAQLQQFMLSEDAEKSERLDYIFESLSLDLSFLESTLEQGKKEGVFRELSVPVVSFLLLLSQNAQNALSLKPLAPYVLHEQAPTDDVLIEATLDVLMAGILSR
jgi:AcrR family transcriptional regulator